MGTNLKVIQMPIFKDWKLMCFHTDENKRKVCTYMTYITDKDEISLQNYDFTNLVRGNRTFQVSKYDICCFGEVNFNPGSDDIKDIDSLPFLDYLRGVGIKIPSNYDYETHSCTTPINCYQTTETWQPSVLAKYCHGCLGKPDKIIIFNKVYK